MDLIWLIPVLPLLGFCALVVLGGLHVASCPGEAAPHADALAIGDGVPLWPRILTGPA